MTSDDRDAVKTTAGAGKTRLEARVFENTRSLSPPEGQWDRALLTKRSIPMKRIPKLAALSLEDVMTQIAVAARQAPERRNRPAYRYPGPVIPAEINKDSSPFWELPQPKPQEILTGLQSQTPVDMSGVTTTEQTITQDGRTVSCTS